MKSRALSGRFLGETHLSGDRERQGGALTSERSEKLTSLYETYCPRVLAYALRRTSMEEAEEVVAESFIVAWRRLDEVPDDPFRGCSRGETCARQPETGRRSQKGS